MSKITHKGTITHKDGTENYPTDWDTGQPVEFSQGSRSSNPFDREGLERCADENLNTLEENNEQ